MSASLQIRLLGGFALTHQGERVKAIEKSARLQALLVYLLLNATRPQPRRQIAFIFWPDTTESQARTNLRKLVYQLQRRLPQSASYLAVDRHALQWNGASSYQLDVELLEDALQKAEQDPSVDEAFDDIIRLYKRPLLPTFGEDWLRERREALQRRVIKALTARADYCERRALFDEATAVVHHLLSLNPFDELFYQRLMRLRALAGDHSGAVRAYQAGRTMLQEELGVVPSPRTELLYERIVSGATFSGGAEKARSDQISLPLINRRAEWQRLQAAPAALQSGDSRCVWISGEAGIGKTRLAEELLTWTYLDGYVVARTRSYSAHGDLAYAPVARLFRRSPLSRRLAGLADVWQSELSRILPELLADRPELPLPNPLTQGAHRVRFYEALCEAILSNGEPVILFFDDLQWCDEGTLGWLQFLLQRDHNSRLLVVGAYRDDEIDADHPLHTLSNSLYREGQLVDIRLLPLAEKDAAQLAEAVCEESLNAATRRELYASTQGNPLFVVEIMRALRSGGEYDAQDVVAGRGSERAELPTKVSSLIHYRLGRLSRAAQEVLKVAALIGRSFDLHLLTGASRLGEETIVDVLGELSARRVISEQQAGQFDFTHDMLRDIVLSGIGATQKRVLSRHIARAYEAVYEDRLDDIVGELAVACEEAGDYQRALTYYRQAAEVEVGRGAYQRAQTILKEALALVDEAGEQSDLAAEELTLHLILASVTQVLQYTSPQVRAAFTRALELSRAVGDPSGQLQALFGLAHYAMNTADLTLARDFSRQCIAVAEQIDDQQTVVRAYLMFGFLSLILGEFGAAKESMERARAHSNSALAKRLTTLQGEDTAVMANIFLSVALWYLGRPEQSDNAMAEARALATELGLPINLVFVHSYGMLFGLIKHDISEVEQHANRLVKMSELYDIGIALFSGRLGQAYVSASRQPDNWELFDEFVERLTIYQEQVTALSQPLFLSLKARLLMGAKRYQEAEAALEEAIARMDALDDRYSAGEVYRVQAKVAALSGKGDPEESYLHAIAVSTAQKAKMPQLRVVLDLCRLWRRQGRAAEAYRLLDELYDSFSEGFGAPELQEARELLDELERS